MYIYIYTYYIQLGFAMVINHLRFLGCTRSFSQTWDSPGCASDHHCAVALGVALGDTRLSKGGF